MREFNNRSTEHWALIRRSDVANHKLAIFVHGFLGGYLDTWGRLPDLLKKEADSTPPFDAWDYLFLGYDTRNVDTYLDIARLIETPVRQAVAGQSPFKQPYTKIALIGHSLGTLGIRQYLCAWSMQPPDFPAVLKSVVLFGSPLNGSPHAAIAALLYKIAESLKPKNPQLRMLKNWFGGAYQRAPWPATQLVIGLDDQVVGHDDLVEWPGDQNFTTNFDHRSLVKPGSWTGSGVIDQISNALA